MSLFTKNIHIISLSLLLSLSVVAAAESYHSSARGGVEHYLSLSLDGGMAISPAKTDLLSSLPRAEAGASVNYELQYRALLAGVGVGFGFEQTASRLTAYRDSYDRITRDGDAVRYHYDFTSFTETRSLMQVRVPVYIGATFAEYMYALAGATVGFNLTHDYQTRATMLTAADYSSLPGTISGNLPYYGYGIYPESPYATKASMLPSSATARLSLSPTVEIGARIPLMDKLALRVGLFAAYELMLSTEQPSEKLLDLSAVDLSPYTQSQSNLAENLRLAPLAHTDLAPKGLLNNILVGLRVTLSWRVSSSRHACMCLQ